MKKINVYVVFFLLSFTSSVHANDAGFLTVDELIAHGYKQLSGEKILQLMNTKKIKVVDIETEAVLTSRHNSQDDKPVDAVNREFKTKKDADASSMLDARLLARAPLLEGKIERKVVGDVLVTTDGLRTYNYRLYKKQEELYAVRDIDNGNVFFKVEVK